ncbi:hypothetical protein D3C87_1482910 [compost metagenome]
MIQKAGVDPGHRNRQHGDGGEACKGRIPFGLSLIARGAGGGGFAFALDAAQQGLAPLLHQSQHRARIGDGQDQALFGQFSPTFGRLGFGVDQGQTPRGVHDRQIPLARRRAGIRPCGLDPRGASPPQLQILTDRQRGFSVCGPRIGSCAEEAVSF